MEAALAAMRDALLTEVETLRADRAQSAREVHGGVRLRTLGRRTAYAFPDVPGARLSDDLPVQLVVGDREIAGEVASHRDGELVLGLAEDLGAVVEHALLVTDASFLLERLAHRLDDVISDEATFSYDGVSAVLDGAGIRTGRAAAPDGLERALNAEQVEAVRLALGSSAAYVWGPPGTGKTTTVAHLVAALARAGRSVLLVANTNTAVDTAIERIAALLRDGGDAGGAMLAEGRVLRPGTIVQEGVAETWQDTIVPDAVAHRLAQPLIEERARVAAELDKLDAGEMTLDADHDVAAEKDRLRTRLEQIDDRLAADAEALYHRASVIATTVYQTWLGGLPDRPYDVVVVDEASMLMLPMTAYAAGLARRSVVIAGDFRQLPAIVATTDPAATRWLATDAFTSVGLPDDLAAGRQPPYLAALATQYRMREPIAAVVTELFYADNPLRTGRSVPADARQPLRYADTGPLGAWAGFAGRGSRYNPVHAVLVAALVSTAADAGPVAVVTPYAAQERLIAALLTDRFGREARGWVSTVHRFQGNEKDLVVVDLADAPGVSPGPASRARGRDDPQARLLNVAVSRARDELVVVADAGYVTARTPGRGTARALLAAVRRDGAPVPVAELMHGPWSLAAEGDLVADLESATEEIALFTPAVNGHGMARWSRALRDALRRGVGVRVVTRPSGSPVLDQMREAGVAVDLWAGAEERLAVVDGSVTWLGGVPLGVVAAPEARWLRCRGTALPVALAGLLRPPRSPKRPWSEPVTDDCDRCGGPTVLYRGYGGPSYRCHRCG